MTPGIPLYYGLMEHLEKSNTLGCWEAKLVIQPLCINYKVLQWVSREPKTEV